MLWEPKGRGRGKLAGKSKWKVWLSFLCGFWGCKRLEGNSVPSLHGKLRIAKDSNQEMSKWHHELILRLRFSKKDPGTGREDVALGCTWRKHDPWMYCQEHWGKRWLPMVSTAHAQYPNPQDSGFLCLQSALLNTAIQSTSSHDICRI